MTLEQICFKNTDLSIENNEETNKFYLQFIIKKIMHIILYHIKYNKIFIEQYHYVQQAFLLPFYEKKLHLVYFYEIILADFIKGKGDIL